MFHIYEIINLNQVYFIAEMSANHGGDLDVALQMVREAVEAGADCLKIQTYTADSMTIDCDKDVFKVNGGLWNGYKLYDLYKDAATPYEWHDAIKNECEKCGIDFLSTPFDKAATDFLDDLGVEAYKIASFELVDIPLIEYTASKGKPIIMSCGMASVEEIQDAVDACRRVGNEQIILLKCCSEYPAPWADMVLMNIPDMKKRFNLPIGLSDHSAGSLGSVVGATLGACVIEKHVKTEGVDSVDAEFSMTMEEFKAMVEDVKAAKMMCTGPDYSLTVGEQNSVLFRRSLFAARDIVAGERFTEDNIRSIRPGNGIMPKYFNHLLGAVARRDIAFGEPIEMRDLPEHGDVFFMDDVKKNMFFYPDGSKITAEDEKKEIEIFVDFYSRVYYYICKDNKLENRIEDILNTGLVDLMSLIDVMLWKTGAVYADKESGMISGRWGSLKTKEVFEVINRIDEISDSTLPDVLEKVMACDGYGAVYALTIVCFSTGGSYPIYDKYAHIALMMITSPNGFDRIITDTERRNEFDFDSRNGQKVYEDYKKYISKLKTVFNDNWKTDRRIDRALWAYGHLFSDNATNRRNKGSL